MDSLTENRLGTHLEKTQTEVEGLFTKRFHIISADILEEDERDFRTYEKVKELRTLNSYPLIIDIVKKETRIVTGDYLDNRIGFEQIEYYYDNLLKLGFSKEVIGSSMDLAQKCFEARENKRIGDELFNSRDYLGALARYTEVTDVDMENQLKAQQKIDECLQHLYLITEKMAAKGRYDLAMETLSSAHALLPEAEEIAFRIDILEQKRKEEEKNLVVYKGPVQHIFFHPLLPYPQLAFDGDSQARGFNEWFVTVSEFKGILESLYAKDFILIDIGLLYKIDTSSGKEKIVPRELILPQGKKPLVLSIDDLNYYRYMIGNGTVHKLILDENGKIATYSRDPEGEDVISYHDEIIPILDAFVEEHPDFSFRGAKGIIALTGYEGILGYRTRSDRYPDYLEERERALKVVEALKENGWTFASHSQGHINVREDTYDNLVRDTLRWDEEVKHLVGETDVYIYPFGASVPSDDPKFNFLQESGFKVFCHVGPNPNLKFADNYILMERRHIDGIAFLLQADSYRDLFDSEAILDPLRPPL